MPVINGQVYELNNDGTYHDYNGGTMSSADMDAQLRARPIMGGGGAGGAGSRAGGGVPTCGTPGYEYDASTGRCGQSRQTQTQDLALQSLKSMVGGGASAPSSPASAYRASALPPASMPGGSSSSSTTTTTTSGGGGGGDHVARPDFKPAGDANLLRAKDKQGQIAASALTGLRGALGERGMLGSGAETGGTADIAAKGLQSLTDVNREGLIQNDQAAQQYDLAGYQGDISQRGQDLSSNNAMAALRTQERGQDIGANVAFRGQDVTARGQDIAGQSQAGQLQLAQQNAIMQALRNAALY